LERYIDYQQRLDQVRNKIISAAIYPMILLAVGTCNLVGYVVPRFAEVYQGSGRDLPWLSQLILEWGKFAQTHIGMVLFSIFALTVSLVLFIRHLNQTGALARILDRIPGIGERRHIYELSRLYLTLGMLLEGGIPVTQALDTVSAILKFEMRNNLASAKSAIESGNSFFLSISIK
jgi:general secretion pathway protein F